MAAATLLKLAPRTNRWHAASAQLADDGHPVWEMWHEDDTITSWSLRHNPSGGQLDHLPSLRAIRVMVAADPAAVLAEMADVTARRAAILRRAAA